MNSNRVLTKMRQSSVNVDRNLPNDDSDEEMEFFILQESEFNGKPGPKNSNGNPTKRGELGNHYCGKGNNKSPIYQCDYNCDGQCGPNNGCNCSSCKALDESLGISSWHFQKIQQRKEFDEKEKEKEQKKLEKSKKLLEDLYPIASKGLYICTASNIQYTGKTQTCAKCKTNMRFSWIEYKQRALCLLCVVDIHSTYDKIK